MAFETTYKVCPVKINDQDELDDFCFVKQGELQQALRSKEEYLLAYFLRTRRYQLFPDFLQEGQQTRAFRGSIVEGPREEEPALPDRKMEELEMETIAKAIPKQDFPSQFQQLELRTYGLNVGRRDDPFERRTADVDYSQFEQLSLEAVRRAHALGQKVAEWETADREQDEISYAGCLRQVKDNLLLVSYERWKRGTFSGALTMGDLGVVILGLGQAGEDLIQALNLQDLGRVIRSPKGREFYLCDSRQQGLAYQFSLEQFIREILTDEEGEPRYSEGEVRCYSDEINSFLLDYDNVIL